MLGVARSNMKILHPLPRVNEIAMDVDSTPYAYYFDQAQNGLYIREAPDMPSTRHRGEETKVPSDNCPRYTIRNNSIMSKVEKGELRVPAIEMAPLSITSLSKNSHEW